MAVANGSCLSVYAGAQARRLPERVLAHVLARVGGGLLVALVAVSAVSSFPSQAAAQSLREALASAYATNPTLDAARAALRATDENVSQALAGYRPSISGSADAGITHNDTAIAATGRTSNTFDPRGFAITLTQPIFQGFRVVNSVRQAESLVNSGREVLRNAEQNTLFSAVDAYMNVVRDLSVVRLRRNNVSVLNEQLRATRDRFEVGEVTRTDVAQAEARLSGATSALSLAEANLASSRAVFQQVIGIDARGVANPPSIERLLPRSLNEALAIAEVEHPAIQSAIFVEAAARYQVDATKGELYPTVTVEGSYSNRWDSSPTTSRSETATVTGRVTVPIYQRGAVSSRVRQARETELQRRIQVAEARQQVRAAIVSAWGQLTAIRAQTLSSEAQVRASSVALEGVREEAKVGQRTVLDVLDAEQELLDARVTLVTTQRDRVVASYAVLSAIGRLSARRLALPVAFYDPAIHYSQVRNKWYGTGIPGLD